MMVDLEIGKHTPWNKVNQDDSEEIAPDPIPTPT